ncbi:hypothetical protein JCM11641_000074 [Rhodosporidiobolus odoratus]
MAPRVILVTGSSMGFGRSLVETILARGDIAIATLRKPDVLAEFQTKYGEDRLLVLPLDVTKKEQVDAAFSAVKERFGGLDVLINNAGISAFGEVEATPEDESRKLFETNFFAPLDITKKAVAFFREVNHTPGGTIIQISSNVAHRGLNGLGIYSATKAALESVTEALADELDPAWNISFTIVEPGAFGTNLGNNLAAFAAPPAYSSPALPVNQFRALLPTYPIKGDPQKAAQAILKTLDEPKEKLHRLVLGDDAIASAQAKVEEWKAVVEKNEAVAKTVNFDV